MKTTFIATIGALGLMGTVAFAQSATDQIVADLQAQGFTRIEIEEGTRRIEVEAIRDGEKVEIEYDAQTGAIISQRSEPVDSDDETAPGVFVELDDDQDDRDDDDDHDDDDRDDDDDDNDDDDDDSDDDDDDGGDDD